MPTYEYECKSCSHNFEIFQSMSDPPLKDCPECGREIRRLIFGGAGVIFKGSGFYVTDKAGSSGKAADKSADKSGDKTTDKPKPCDAAKCDSCPMQSNSASSSGEASKTESKSA
ncbi:MAG: zinc ribbon domain-containing protein [Treponema sp.]|nr:zinc ribbon domain-containing protein [Treponema sp.]